MESARCWPTHCAVASRLAISDSGDNPTAGGAGDTPIFVGRLLAHPDFASGARTAIYASIPDPAAVAH